MGITALQRIANRCLAHVQLARQRANRTLGLAGLAAAVNDQVAVEGQLDATGTANCGLKRGVATGVPAGIEVGEAVQRFAIAGRVVEQVGDTEIHATATREDFVADRTFPFIGVGPPAVLGKGDADLHRTTGLDRIERAEQLLAERHDAEEVIEDRTQLLFGAHGRETLAIGLAVG